MQDRTSATTQVTIRFVMEDDDAFVQEVLARLVPARPTPGRDHEALLAWYERFAHREFPQHEDSETVIATDPNGIRLGLLTIRPDTEYFTGAPRAYIETLVVAVHAEGQGVARALMQWAVEWARSRGATAIALDVFASNERAIAFYRKADFVEDFVRMVKPLDPPVVASD